MNFDRFLFLWIALVPLERNSNWDSLPLADGFIHRSEQSHRVDSDCIHRPTHLLRFIVFVYMMPHLNIVETLFSTRSSQPTPVQTTVNCQLLPLFRYGKSSAQIVDRLFHSIARAPFFRR